MNSIHLPLIMMTLFLTLVVFARVGIQYFSVGDSGIRPGSKLKTKREILISYAMFGTLVVQLVLSWLYVVGLIGPQVELGSAGTWIGVVLCVIGIVSASYCQFAMGKNWRIGVDPDEKTELVTTGIYSKIRNPIYTACMIFGLGLLVLAPNAYMLITGLVGFFAVQAYVRRIEEPYLIGLHGEEYLRYMESTGSFLPRIRS